MTQWTDADFTLTVEGADLTAATDIHVTISQGNYVVDLTDAAVLDATHLQCSLSQRQTSGFSENAAEMQVNFLVAGKRKATDIVQVNVYRDLLKKVIPDG